jgi:hypothetical protein
MAEAAANDERLRAMDALIAQRDHEIAFKQALIDKLTHEMVVLKRLKFAATSERFASTLSPEQRSLLEETLDTDIGELEGELVRHRKTANKDDEKKQPRRAPLPDHLPRRDVPHEPTHTTCGCGESMKRIGEDVAEKLDYQPGVFSVERHVRGKWVCKCCERIVQAPVPAHVIDKGISAEGQVGEFALAEKLLAGSGPLRARTHSFLGEVEYPGSTPTFRPMKVPTASIANLTQVSSQSSHDAGRTRRPGDWDPDLSLAKPARNLTVRARFRRAA